MINLITTFTVCFQRPYEKERKNKASVQNSVRVFWGNSCYTSNGQVRKLAPFITTKRFHLKFTLFSLLKNPPFLSIIWKICFTYLIVRSNGWGSCICINNNSSRSHRSPQSSRLKCWPRSRRRCQPHLILYKNQSLKLQKPVQNLG